MNILTIVAVSCMTSMILRDSVIEQRCHPRIAKILVSGSLVAEDEVESRIIEVARNPGSKVINKILNSENRYIERDTRIQQHCLVQSSHCWN